MSNTKKRGFSLVEIMIVIAIIGILGALGWVAYSRTLSSSRNAQRRDALKAIQLGIVELYNATKRPADTIYFLPTGALIRNQGAPASLIIEIDNCLPQFGCVFVPLKDSTSPSVFPNAQGLGHGVGSGSVYRTNGSTTNSTTRYIFRTINITDGNLLGACLEDGTVYELSTSLTKTISSESLSCL